VPGIRDAVLSVNALTARLDDLQPLVALGARLWVSWQFLKAGLLKVQDWDTTLYLFRDEYRVPLLPPEAAAVAGTAGEIVFPALLALGLLNRVGAIGLFLVNALAVVAYAHVLLREGFEAAIAQHYLWGFMLLVLAVYGNGPLALDRLLGLSAAPAHG
jgi:putative oxidoreductase